MSPDIRHLLASAADDSDQPLRQDVGLILTRGRRAVRRRRLAMTGTAVLSTAAVISGITAWSAARPDSEGPAGPPGITIDEKSGRVTDTSTGRTAAAPPSVSPLSDAEVLRRCKGLDAGYVQMRRTQQFDDSHLRAGTIDQRWKVVVKAGDTAWLSAMFRSPDGTAVMACNIKGPGGATYTGRASTTEVRRDKRQKYPHDVEAGYRIPVPGVARVLVDDPDRRSDPSEALVGTDGFFALRDLSEQTMASEVRTIRIRAYDRDGRQIFERVERPQPTPAPAGPGVTIKTAKPIQPVVELTKDPENGRPLAPPPPVSPLRDDEIRGRCQVIDKQFSGRPAKPGDTAGPITPAWMVALKTGTGSTFTALLVSPGRNVVSWCHSRGTEYAYSRRAVNADGTFGDPTQGINTWALVPTGVARLIVDLPAGPTRALISNGYYIWGLTGGNSDLKNVRVRGFDAQGKKVYDQKIPVDAG